nr:MAG TPA: hypothetical protein [Caudoviricetes sp.]
MFALKRGIKGAKGVNFYIFMVKIICILTLIYAYFIRFLSYFFLYNTLKIEYRGLKSFYNLKK